jgi:hypothetical protein
MALIADLAASATRPAWLDGPEWHQADPDLIFGLDALAAYLRLPFLRVREMHVLGHIPTEKRGRNVVASKMRVARHFAAVERLATGGAYIVLGLDGSPLPATDLLRLNPAIATHLGITVGAVRYHRAAHGLPVFKLGKTPFARRSSLDRWAATDGAVTYKERRQRRREEA